MPYSHTQFIASLRRILEGPPPRGEPPIKAPRVIYATPDGRHRLLAFPPRPAPQEGVAEKKVFAPPAGDVTQG